MKRGNRGVAASVGVALLAALVAGVAGFSGASSASGREKLSDAAIREIGIAWSRQDGEVAPRSMKHVESTRATAVLAMSRGDVVPEVNEVFLIEMEGDFVDEHAPRPPGMPAPAGSVLTVIVDAYTGQTTDIGISDRKTDLATLGPVTTHLTPEPPAGADPNADGVPAPEPPGAPDPNGDSVLIPGASPDSPEPEGD
jgi:hypothetical protein